MSDSDPLTPETYVEPVAYLLILGERDGAEWPDYPGEWDLTAADVPDLVRMVQDKGLLWAYSDTDEVWAPIHAWRALAQLRAEEAVPGLLAAFYVIDEQEGSYMMDEMPLVMGMIGPGAIPALAAYLADPEQGMWSRITAGDSIEKIVKQYPEARAQAVAILTGQLGHYENQEPTLNALLISALVEMEAVEAQEVMAAAFAAGKVDLTVQGDWEEVQIELGLLEERLTPKPEKGWNPGLHDLAQTMKMAIEQEVAREQAQKRIEETRRRQDWGEVGRNDPCPCGSGRKYKRCHGRAGS